MTSYNDYKKYLTSANTLIRELAYYDRAKSKYLVDEFCSKLKNSIIDISQLEPYEKAIKSACIVYNDKAISNTDYMHDLDEQTFSLFIDTCTQQEKLLNTFHDKKWPVPAIHFHDVAGLKNNTINRKNANALTSKLIDADGRLSNTLKKAKSEYSIKYCEKADAELKELKDLLVQCKSNSINISGIKNKDIKKATKKIEEIKDSIRAVDAFHKAVYDRDRQLYTLTTASNATDPIISYNIVALCKEQKAALEDCKARSYPMPKDLKVKELDHVIALYTKYTITERIKALDSKIDIELIEAKKNSDLNKCNQARAYLYQIQQLTDLGRKSGFTLHLANNNEKTISDCESSIKAAIKIADDLEAEIKNLYSELSNTIPQQEVTQETCQQVFELCNKLRSLIERHGKLSGKQAIIDPDNLKSIKEQFSLYHEMAEINDALPISIKTINNTASIKNFIEKCHQQIDNIRVCKNRHWRIPTNFKDPQSLITRLNDREDKLINGEARKKKRRTYIENIVAVAIFVIIAVSIVMFVVNKQTEKKIKEMVSIPFDLSEAENGTYSSIKKQFEEAGFTNINASKSTNGYYPSNTVIEVTVGGNAEYKKGTKVKKDTPVTVTVASDNRIDVTDVVNDWKKRGEINGFTDEYELSHNFAFVGFPSENITIKESLTDEHSKDGKIESILIGGVKYESGKCYADKETTIAFHVFKSETEDED